jgi:oligopeptide transport system substrate-binding protein
MLKTSVKFTSLIILFSLLAGLLAACASPVFSINSINMTSEKIAVGQNATIEANVTNSGKAEGAYSISLKVNNALTETKYLTIGAGQNTKVSFTFYPPLAGSYFIDVNGLTGNLVAVKPAEFVADTLDISAEKILAGESVTLNAVIKNLGGVEGTYTAKFKLDGIEANSQTIIVGPESTQKISFITKPEAGTHTFEFNGISKTVTVLKPASLKITSLNTSPEVIFPGQVVSLEAEVFNDGSIKGGANITLFVNGKEADSLTVSLEGQKSDNISFKLTTNVGGTYDIKVGEKSTTFHVVSTQIFNNEKYYYSIEYPEDWTVVDEKKETVRISKENIGDVLIFGSILPVEKPLEQSVEQINNSLYRALPGIMIYKSYDFYKDEKLAGIHQYYSFTKDMIHYRGINQVFKKGRHCYAVTGYANGTNWESSKSTIEAVINSFVTPEVATEAYIDNNTGFSLTLPDGWDALKKDGKRPYLVISTPIEKPVLISNLYLYSNNDNKTAQYFAEDAVMDLTTGTTSYVVLSKNETTVGMDKGYDIVCSFQYDTLTLKARVMSLLHGSQAYVLVLYSTYRIFDENASTLTQLFDSFKTFDTEPFGLPGKETLFEFGTEIVTLDPALSEEGPTGIIGAIFSGLIKIDEKAQPQPDLAKGWEVNRDNTVYTFHLRDNAKFHDGRAVTASDVKYSWERACDPITKSDKAGTYLGDIVGAIDMINGQVKEISGIKVVDDHTLQVTIDGPKPYFLAKIAHTPAFIVDKGNVSSGKTWYNQPNGAGPFKLKEWKKDQLLILERNNDFYLGPVKLKNIVFRLFAGNPMTLYDDNEIDITDISLDYLETVTDPSSSLNKELISTVPGSLGYIAMNNRMEPFDDPKVRQAFALSLDLDKLIEIQLKGAAKRAAGFVPPGVPGYNPDLSPLPYDPEKARQSIKESRYGDVDKLPAITFYTYLGLNSIHEAMIAMWKQNLGVDIHVEAVQEPEEYYIRKHNREFQLFSTAWSADYLDPQNFLEVLFQSQSKENTSSYANKDVDMALKAAAVEPNPDKRLKAYRDIEKIILADLPVIPFYCDRISSTLIKPRVKGYSGNQFINYWREIYIDTK